MTLEVLLCLMGLACEQEKNEDISPFPPTKKLERSLSFDESIGTITTTLEQQQQGGNTRVSKDPSHNYFTLHNKLFKPQDQSHHFETGTALLPLK